MNKVVSMDEMIPLIDEQLKNNGEVKFTPRGKSMYPTLISGEDTVTIVKPEFPLKLYSMPLYKRDNGEYVLHRVIKIDGDKYTMRGDNQYIAEEGIREEQIIGVVKEYTHNGKIYSGDDVKNRMYGSLRKNTVKPRKVYIKTRGFLGKIKRKILGAN